MDSSHQYLRPNPQPYNYVHNVTKHLTTTTNMSGQSTRKTAQLKLTGLKGSSLSTVKYYLLSLNVSTDFLGDLNFYG